MEVINELKEFDSLHNEWKTLGRQISSEELSTEMSGDDNDVYGFEYGYLRKNHKDQGWFNDVNANDPNEFDIR